MTYQFQYTEEDLTLKKGHVYTTDKKYYLIDEGDYSYWMRVKEFIEGEVAKFSYLMGAYSFDYCFRTNLEGCVDTLNKVRNRHEKLGWEGE